MYEMMGIITFIVLCSIIVLYIGCVWSVIYTEWTNDSHPDWVQSMTIPLFGLTVEWNELRTFHTLVWPAMAAICSALSILIWPLLWLIAIALLIARLHRNIKRKEKEAVKDV